jgi:DNA-directed RNA polymerase specialized sigma24 family protein
MPGLSGPAQRHRAPLVLGTGDTAALDRLLPLLYDDLRRVARGYLQREGPGHTLQATLRFFAGLNIPETADALGVSTPTVDRDWAMAKARLHQRLSTPQEPPAG